MKTLARLVTIFAVGCGLGVGSPSMATAPSFDREIRPLLADHCFACHGPDDAQRQADLRLDTRAGLFSDRDEGPVVRPGKPQESELYRRIMAAGDEKMPPPEGHPLDISQRDMLRRWIEAGAPWEAHWSLVSPRRPALPQESSQGWCLNAVDGFVAARHRQQGLIASKEADKTTLLRRVTLDLTGLPPTPDEVDAFLADATPNAYEKVVDRLLASPRFGENMALTWLDASRYADTSGYQNDGPREMWRWRDWVIDAYNAGQPFDAFTLEQLAGDLLPSPTLQQRIATGFNRNHRGNSEGGIIPEEYQVEYVVDRVETTSTVWLGLTLGCARCHDHKFDPVTQRDFYRVFAFFNNIDEHGRATKEGNSAPYIPAPTIHQQQQLLELQRQLAEARSNFSAFNIRAAMQQSRAEQRAALGDWTVEEGQVAHFTLDSAADPAHLSWDGAPISFEVGRIDEAAVFTGAHFANAGDVGKFGYHDRFSVATWIKPDPGGGTILSRMADESRGAGYYLQLVDGHLHVNLVVRWLDDSLRVSTAKPLPAGRWCHIAVTYDGSAAAGGVRVFVNGEPQELRVHLDALNQSFASDQPLRIGGSGAASEHFHGRIDDLRIYERTLAPQDVLVLAVSESVAQIADIPEKDRSPGEAAKLRRHFLEQLAGGRLRRSYEELRRLERAVVEAAEAFPTVMVMQERATPRPTFILERGQYDHPGEPVAMGVPASLPPMPAEHPRNRLGFAQWLMQPDHPLTARVAVNRFWQHYLGTGLVKTAEDFGTQGERPSHPQLLDWLATEFSRRWDVKSLHRQLVTSATYRQDSATTKELRERDPENRLLARGPRYRLRAETIRDQALAASGVLIERLGGASVKTYQPADLWKDIATDSVYELGKGPELYRRSLYTYWKRTVSPPTMATFDASTRETCRMRVARTNTPLQALSLMNDVTFVESARLLAERVIRFSANPAQRLRHAFRLVLARQPNAEEMRILTAALDHHLQRFAAEPAAAQQLLEVGQHPKPIGTSAVQVAGYATIASLLFNLDEAVTKQ